LNILFIGDVVGKPGRLILKKKLKQIIKDNNIDIIIVNAENAAGGNGLTRNVADELFEAGADFLTMGNHVWDKKEILDFIEEERRLIRPANYPAACPGRGSEVISIKGYTLGVINVSGRIFLDPLDCPFTIVNNHIKTIIEQTKCIVVDVHAEATSEKLALGWYLDGLVSAVVGTHTHVQTADERLLPKGTAYITDVGMTGPLNSILGVDKDIIINKFLTQMPKRFEVAKGPVQINAVIINIDETTGKAVSINRMFNTYEM
jgi:metallophosphoesterase (TIGR00282 family)